MEFVPDIDRAKKQVIYNNFSEYSPAYVVTNENLRTIKDFMPQNCNRALTVAASGDHPLFCSLYGAKQVDTFDISYNAKCIMDIKTAAIQYLNHSDYLGLLESLHNCYDVTKILNMAKISKLLPKVEFEYLCSMAGFELFNRSYWIGEDNPRLPTEQEYQKLKTIVKKNYSFIMSDIATLNTCLTKNYDFIHLSNVIDYVHNLAFQETLLVRFLKHLNIGGRILVQHMLYYPWEKSPISINEYNLWRFSADDVEILKNVRFIKSVGDISIFERVR